MRFIAELRAPEGVGWFARVVVYTSPTGLADDPRAVYLEVVEVGRKQDLPWARKQVRAKFPDLHLGAWSR